MAAPGPRTRSRAWEHSRRAGGRRSRRASLPNHYLWVGRVWGMPHLSELHGPATHLAVVAVPVYLLILLVRRSGRGGTPLAAAEPWVVGAAVAGVALAGLTGLLVWGQSKTMLRGHSGRLGTVHFYLGIVLAVIVVGVAAWRFKRATDDRHTHGLAPVAGGLPALVAV